MKEAAKYLAALLLAALLLWWVLRDKEPSQVWNALKQVSLPLLAVAALLNILHTVPRVWRWGVLLRPVRADIPFRPMFSAVNIGYMTTWIVPGRIGELVRPALLSGKENVPLGPSLGSIVADRLLDGITVVVLCAVAVLVDSMPGGGSQGSQLFRAGAFGLLGAVAVALVVLLVFSFFHDSIEAWLRRRSGVVAWVGRTGLSLARGVAALRRPRLLPALGLHSLTVWLVIGLSTWIGVLACGVRISFGQVLILGPLLVLGVAIPTPGNVGGYQVMMTVGLEKLFGVEPAIAAGTGIVMWLMIVVPPILLGVALLFVEKISWRTVLAAARQVRTIGSADPEADPVEQPVEDVP